jgi:hypothetical protein
MLMLDRRKLLRAGSAVGAAALAGTAAVPALAHAPQGAGRRNLASTA